MPIFRLFRKNKKKESAPSFAVHSAGLSHRGNVRETNQDAFMFPDKASCGSAVMAVADGMGGHEGGEVAAKQCIKIFGETLKDGYDGAWRWPDAWGKPPKTGERDLESFILEHALMTAHLAISKLAREDSTLHDMGTTFTGALIEGETLYSIHAGDSRLFLYRNGFLKQLTRDHRFDPAVSDTLMIPAELAERYTLPNVLTQSVGNGPLKPDLDSHKLQWGDVLLFCSDGLTDMISDEHIRRILGAEPSAQQRAQALIDAALLQGGRDNVTAVVATCQ
ncbi:PP2C family protein-serine/threonine phosphatase [Acanthopleuribacter pedis]|nr:protein phosphatase 2C domain-containing protein [Acanthopleuribacter pedis]